MVEWVDTLVLEASAERHESSSLSEVTFKIITEAVKMGYFNLTLIQTKNTLFGILSYHGPVTQLVECRAHNARVPGSSPGWTTINKKM